MRRVAPHQCQRQCGGFRQPKNSYLMPGYARVDATATYSFGHTGRESKRYRIAVNFQNLLDHPYYETGRTQTSFWPGSPVNVLTEFQIRF